MREKQLNVLYFFFVKIICYSLTLHSLTMQNDEEIELSFHFLFVFCSFCSYSCRLEPHTADPFSNNRVSLSSQDRILFDALIAEENSLSPKKRHYSNGRFLTMHKRRRKKLQTRSLSIEPAVLDDILHGQVVCILKQVGNWRFNAFSLENVTGGERYSLANELH